jgi:molecular chaperone HtpG
MAALRLARQFTARIESRAPSRLYLNLDNPAVQALLRAQREGHPQAEAAARLLRSLKIIVAAQGRPLARARPPRQARISTAPLPISPVPCSRCCAEHRTLSSSLR